MSTYFISDLHLCDEQPLITQLFVRFCREKAFDAQALYILGDFFEYWLGDDATDGVSKKTVSVVQQELRQLNELGTKIYFMAGNRDFLLGQDFAEKCGMEIIHEPKVIDLYGEQVLLVHGDAECIDDEPYQKARAMFRNPKWQLQFLQMNIQQRVEFAEKARQQSQQHTSKAGSEIMDVNQAAIDHLYSKHQVKSIIHGHTHRPAVHKNNDTTRIVLGDWHHQSNYLVVDEYGMQLISS